jgi:hypothetical protein
VAQAKLELARDLITDLQRIDTQRREVKRRITRAVATAPTSITEVYGVGPMAAATVLGYVRDIRRFPSRDRAVHHGLDVMKERRLCSRWSPRRTLEVFTAARRGRPRWMSNNPRIARSWVWICIAAAQSWCG